MQALQKAPKVCETESDPLLFVKRCNFDMWSAAKRLCLYWKERLSIFGPQRAFLPLTLTGDGALTVEDVMSLHAGYPAILPEHAASTGQCVVFLDRRAWLPYVSTVERRLRTIFYIFKVVAEEFRPAIVRSMESDEEAKNGSNSQDSKQQQHTLQYPVLFLGLVAHAGRTSYHELEAPWVYRALTLFQSAMPIKFEFHVLNMPVWSSRSKLEKLQHLIKWTAEYVLYILGSSAEIHTESEKGQLMKHLQVDIGLSLKSIPACIGGDWEFKEFQEWCKVQSGKERELKTLAELTENSSSSSPISTASSNQSTDNPTPLSLATAATSTRHFAAAAASSLDTVTAVAESSNVSQPQPRRTTHSTTHLTKEEKEAKRKLADVIKSRRKRERKRKEFSTLKEEVAQLTQENQSLQRDEEQLQQLLQQAQQLAQQQEEASSNNS
uniref:BZIP domain-containing protein n=1 Tax=Entomoneis paludosa TaxID=265537 RepID=A0A7S2VC70_9STRA